MNYKWKDMFLDGYIGYTEKFLGFYSVEGFREIIGRTTCKIFGPFKELNFIYDNVNIDGYWKREVSTESYNQYYTLYHHKDNKGTWKIYEDTFKEYIGRGLIRKLSEDELMIKDIIE